MANLSDLLSSNFQGATGPQGDAGATGAQGVQGIQGITGTAPSLVYIKCPLVSVTTVNDSTSYTNRDVINTTSDFDSGSFTIDSDGITVPTTGYYCCSFTCFMTASSQRVNVGVKFSIAGTEQSEIAAMGYIRNSDGHNETSLMLKTLYYLTSGQKVNLLFARLAGAGTTTLTTNSSVSLYKL